MSSPTRLMVFATLLLGAACAHRNANAPPLTHVEFGDRRAAYRTYSAAAVCEAEPRWLERADGLSFCAPRSHEIYFAYEDEAGATNVLFCDDATVTYAPDGGAPEVSVPPSVKSRALRSRMRSLYVDRARSYPTGEVRVPPAVPPAPEHSRAAR